MKNQIAKASVMLSMAFGILPFVLNTVCCLNLSAEPSTKATTVTEEGVKKTVFETPNGKLNVYVPDDMSDGDTISGTVIAEPIGDTEEEKKQNEDVLSGYVVDVKPVVEEKPEPAKEEKPKVVEKPKTVKPKTAKPKAAKPKTTIAEKPKKPVEKIHCTLSIPEFSCDIPQTCNVVTISLSSPQQNMICQNDVPCLPVPPPLNCKPNQVILPQKGTCGKPVKIRGKCDGRFGNSKILIGKRKCRMLAESPRQQACLTPVDIVGATQIECIEGARIIVGVFNCIQAPTPLAISRPPASRSVAPSEIRNVVSPAAASVAMPTSRPSLNLNGTWLMAATAEGHTGSQPVTVRQNGSSVSWQVPGVQYTGTLSGNTIQFTMSSQIWSGGGTLVIDPSGNSMSGNCKFVFTMNGQSAVMPMQMTRQ